MANEEKIRILDEQPAENAGSLLYIRTLAGSSDASKPTSQLANGSVFIETDTGKVFIFDEDDGWTEMQAGGGGGGGEKFVVTLTPTALDLSGTMDKTVSEINAAYEAGQQIVFRVLTSSTSHMDVACSAQGFVDGTTYPSFNAYIVDDTNNVLLFAYTGIQNDGTKATYSTSIYPLASSGGGVLVVNVTTSGNTMTLDKTWQEIHDSSVPVFGIVRTGGGDVGWAFCADSFEDEGDFVVTCVFGTQSRDFTAASASGYPSFSE